MKKLHTYTRILLSLLLMLVTSVVMGQGLNEANIPIKNITADPDPIDDDHGLKNLYDGKENTTWSAKREDSFQILEYMQIQNPDNTGDGKRSWVEIPYTPNAKTEIEIEYKAEYASDGNTEYLFGCGGLYEPSMSFGLIRQDSEDRFIYANGSYNKNTFSGFSAGIHRLICKSTSFQLDDEDPVTFGSSNTNAAHKLCFFYNPYVDWSGARCFRGKIYSVKIRENGKLLYDLVPACGEGRYGFYDRISADMYGFLDFVDYIENEGNQGWEESPNNHIFIKVPYGLTMGDGYNKNQVTWTGNLVTNGYFENGTVTSYGFVNNAWLPKIFTNNDKKDANWWNTTDGTTKPTRAIQVINSGVQQATPQDWDCQFRVVFDEGKQMVANGSYSITFWCKADKQANIYTQFQTSTGGYYNNVNNGGISVGTTWKKVTLSGSVPQPNTSGDVCKQIGFLLNNLREQNTYYFSNIDIKYNGNTINSNGDLSDVNNLTPFGEVRDAWTDQILTIDGKKCIQVINNGNNGSGAWNCQLQMKLSETLNEGDKYYISYSIKAKESATIYGQFQQDGGGYYSDLNPNVDVTTSWQKVVRTGTIGAHDGSVKWIGLMLNNENKANTYYITDIVIKKGHEISQPLPSATVEVQYQSTQPHENQQLRRHIFTYGTFEEGVMGLSTRYYNRYIYRSGQQDEQTMTPVGENRNTVVGSLQEWDWNNEHNVVSGTPTWTQGSAFYFMGTETTGNADDAASFWGRMYGAKIKEGDVEKVNLVPACSNGEFGLYDKIARKFYGKDKNSADANFSGATPPAHGDGIKVTDIARPYSITIDLEKAKVVKNFYMTTAADKLGDYTNNSPARWTLYGSSGDNQWTELYKYEQTVPKFSELNADGNTEYYLYNVETGRFYVGGNEWETRASLSADKAFRFKVTDNGNGKYSLQDFVTRSDINDWKYVFVNTEGNLWSDYNNNADVDYQNWEITHKGNNQYEISNTTILDGATVGSFSSSNIDNDNRLYLRTDAKNTTWAFISAADYNAYQAAKSLTKGDPMLNGKEYKYAINAENKEYKQFRLVIDQMVANNNQINLADIAFTSYFDFEHYVGRVYDIMGTPPDNLAIDGSSGYKQAYKMKGNAPDDPRLNEGVTIQRTHEYEHEIYLLPGETVDLTPFSDFGSTEWRAYNYMEQYVRWYDYRSDLRSNKLVFDKRDGLKVSTLEKGHFAWNLREDNQKQKDEWRRTREGSLAHYTADASPTADANGVIDIIAIEAGGTFDWDKAEWNGSAYVAKEPTLLWRHTFVIKDAKRRSDEMFASAAANETYISNHKIKLMCPAGTPFQYPLPSYEDKNANATRPTNYFYRVNNGDAENPSYSYEPVYHYSIETIKDGVRLGATNVSFKSVAEEGKGKEDQMAVSFKDLEGLNRVLYIKDPQVGTYTISIHAMNKQCTGGARDDRMGPSTPLLLMQYELEVLPPADGIMVNETELKTRTELSHQIPANMDKAFGKPTTKVDFDEVLPGQTTASGDGHSYLKWPWQWENSSYGFGYENRGDYNMYMVADHMSITPFHGRSTNEKAHDYGDKTTFNNVYDRKYYDNDNDVNKRGYFFYANAASDPSRMSVLNIGKNFCPNTKVFVSAWINEFQGQDLYSETANVIFSFRGVKSDGTEKVLNSFVTGYISGGWNTPNGFMPKTSEELPGGIHHIDVTNNPDNRGKWMHVYYTFKTDDAIDFSEFDHYIITLENNCTSSEGADYAIDDIRCYVRKPQVEASQLKPVCNGDPTTDLKIYADFDQMMDVFGFNEEDGAKSLYYCFLDRKVYEAKLKEAYDAGINDNSISSTDYPTLDDWRENVDKSDVNDPFRKAYEDAFNAALIKNSYGTGNENYGTLTFNKRYQDNVEYSDVENFSSYFNALRQTLGVTRNLIFPCKATDAQMKVGKTYVIALIDSQNFEVSKTIPVNFRLEDQCQSSSDFEVVFSGEVKIDGVLIADQEGKTYCKNQKPIVTIDLNGIDSKGEIYKTEQAYFDWYFGPYLLNAEETADNWTIAYSTEQKNTLLLKDALGYFRDEYPIATQEDVMKDGSSIVAKNTLTDEMLTYIKQMVTEGKLALYMKSEIISTTELYNKQLGHTRFYITAIPIRPADMADDVKFCLSPFKVGINLNQNAPSMKDGDDKGIINYPSDMNDVPLRIGLKQLRRTVIDNLSHRFTESDKLLWLPLREVNGSIEAVSSLKTHVASRKDFDVEPAEIHTATDDLVYLAASNDPAVLAGTSGAVDITTSSSSNPMWPIISDLKVVGKVHSIKAQKGTNNGSVAKMAFLEGFKFREGYWYTLKFHYEDDYTNVTGDHPEACPGDLVFTIKVVPEYQMWTGAVSRNWNDDRNWRRVTSEDLLGTAAATAEYVTDGKENGVLVNDNTSSFAPADFTKVVIPANAPRVPYMYNMREGGNKTSVRFVGAPRAGDQIKTTRPAADIYDQILEAESYEQEYLDLNGKMFVITDLSGQNTLGVRNTGDSPQNAFAATNSSYTDEMFVYAKFTRVVKTGVEGNVYTIQLCKADGTHHSIWEGTDGYLNFQPTGQNTVFALGLNGRYGQDAENCALWKVVSVGDGEVTLQNVGNGGYLNPSVAAPSADPIVCQLAQTFGTTGASGIYHQTSLVQYDMASVEEKTTKDGDVACRPWYDHTCDQIHFNSGAAMMDQRYLYYNKAWCDIEVPVGTWQTVASPLMNIVAGDLYLPTASARQDTPLFEDIFYDAGDSEHPGLNDRFAPAVYQHSWNKSMAKVYELGGDQPRNVGIKLDWSHVYNDVNVRYGAGQGFSIKVDVSAMDEANQPGKGSNPATAKFRFPKADISYTYYNPGNKDGSKEEGAGKKESVNGNDAPNGVRPGRLSNLTADANPVIGDNSNEATSTDYFLVGNPLMCWLDMNAFFEVNNQFKPEYWTVTADGQQTALFSEERGWVSTSSVDPKFLPPGVSFFVKKGVDATTGATTTVTPVFDNTMMSYTQAEPRTDGSGSEDEHGNPTNDPAAGGNNNNNQQYNEDGSQNPRPNNAKTRSANSTMPQLHMTATDVNGRQSRALLMDGTMIQHEGVETLFDSNLKDDALLYTTKDGMAKTIASIAPGDTLPLAVSGARDEVQLSIEGVKDFDFDLFLIDSEEGTVTPLEGDVVLKQTASGVRYYIATRNANDTEVEGDVNVPRVTAKDGYITVYAPAACEIETSAIYNTGGIRLDYAEHIAESHSVKLLPGIYIVHLLCDGKTYTYKLMLR